MSFSKTIKDEVTKIESTRLECIAELSAIVRNSAIFDGTIKVSVENSDVAKRIYKLFKEIYAVVPVITVRRRYNYSKNLEYILEFKDKQKEIVRDLSIFDSNGCFLNVPKDFIISDDEGIWAYLRGLFVSCGSVNDPKTSRYHLEFLVDDLEYAEFINGLLNGLKLNSRILRREKNYMVYIKEAEKIADFLRVIKAYSGVMYYEDMRIYREQKNITNRLNNCEQANMDKVFFTASKQISDIKKLQELGLVDLLDDKLKDIIQYRLDYPEASLKELSEIVSKETGTVITKSGLNHRFRKIREILAKVSSDE